MIVLPKGASAVSWTATGGAFPGTLQARGSRPPTRKSLAVLGQPIVPGVEVERHLPASSD